MKKTVKQKWLNALRSGKYKQGTQCLQSGPNEYCCLGVLCEITGNAQNRDMEATFPIVNFDLDFLACDQSCDQFLGLTPKMQVKLAQLNDDGLNFNEIASYISRNVKAK